MFTNSSSPTVCFSVISIACTMRYCCLSSNVTGTCHCCNIRICVLNTFLWEQNECVNLFSNYENVLHTTSIRVAMEFQISLAELPYINLCHVSYSVTYLYTTVTKLFLVVN